MNLIYFRGLNCHLACVVSIADCLGVDYQGAFGTLWSETDFAYDPEYHIYVSKRVLPNLESLGAKMEVYRCSSGEESEKSFSLIQEGELVVVGTDTFYIPWSQMYQHFHGPHYFFAQKENPDSLLCFDPTYSQINLRLASADVVPHVFDFSRIHRTTADPPRFDAGLDAREILRTHPETQEALSAGIRQCKRQARKHITPLIRRVTAMINNRYLFQRFLRQCPSAAGRERRYFDQAFFSKWEAIKHGLHKASVVENNQSVVDEAHDLFLCLMREETDMAKGMISSESDSD